MNLQLLHKLQLQKEFDATSHTEGLWELWTAFDVCWRWHFLGLQWLWGLNCVFSQAAGVTDLPANESQRWAVMDKTHVAPSGGGIEVPGLPMLGLNQRWVKNVSGSRKRAKLRKTDLTQYEPPLKAEPGSEAASKTVVMSGWHHYPPQPSKTTDLWPEAGDELWGLSVWPIGSLVEACRHTCKHTQLPQG